MIEGFCYYFYLTIHMYDCTNRSLPDWNKVLASKDNSDVVNETENSWAS